MKKFFTLILTTLLATAALTAQSSMEGSIVDETGMDLAATTVKLVHLTDNQLSKEVETDEEGYFFVDNIAAGAYQLQVSHLNYEVLIVENFEFPRDRDQVVGLQLEQIELLTPTTTVGQRVSEIH